MSGGFLLTAALCFSQSTQPESLAQGKIIITPRYDEALIFDQHPETLWDRPIAKTDRRLATLH